MSEAATGLIVLCLVSAALAFLANRRARLSAWGGVLVAVASALVFQILAALHRGYLDPFAPIAFVVSLVVTVPVTLVVGGLVGRLKGAAGPDDR